MTRNQWFDSSGEGNRARKRYERRRFWLLIGAALLYAIAVYKGL
jgi:hypothetical protein